MNTKPADEYNNVVEVALYFLKTLKGEAFFNQYCRIMILLFLTNNSKAQKLTKMEKRYGMERIEKDEKDYFLRCSMRYGSFFQTLHLEPISSRLQNTTILNFLMKESKDEKKSSRNSF